MNYKPGTGRTILVVDDDPAILILIETILANANYRVIAVTGRAAAVRWSNRKDVRIDAALLDVRIPGVWGTSLADEILFARPDIPVIWMSGFVDDDIIRLKLVSEYAGFLSKPLRCSELLALIELATAPMAGPGRHPDPRQRGAHTGL